MCLILVLRLLFLRKVSLSLLVYCAFGSFTMGFDFYFIFIGISMPLKECFRLGIFMLGIFMSRLFWAFLCRLSCLCGCLCITNKLLLPLLLHHSMDTSVGGSERVFFVSRNYYNPGLI
jgi:hypothetical protein